MHLWCIEANASCIMGDAPAVIFNKDARGEVQELPSDEWVAIVGFISLDAAHKIVEAPPPPPPSALPTNPSPHTAHIATNSYLNRTHNASAHPTPAHHPLPYL